MKNLIYAVCVTQAFAANIPKFTKQEWDSVTQDQQWVGSPMDEHGEAKEVNSIHAALTSKSDDPFWSPGLSSAELTSYFGGEARPLTPLKEKTDPLSPIKEEEAVSQQEQEQEQEKSKKEVKARLFVCDICGSRYVRSEHRDRHVRSVHRGQKPFACSVCGKAFSRSDNCAVHVRDVHKAR